MNWQTISILFLTIILVTLVFVSHRWIKKVTNYYWFWLGISAFYLIYMIVLMWSKIWIAYYSHPEMFDPTASKLQYDVISFVFLTNMCYLFAFLLPVSLIADPTRQIARAFAPMACLSSMMVLLVIIPFGFRSDGITFDWEYIFIGGEWPFYDKTGTVVTKFCSLDYFIHLFNLLLSIGVLLNTPRFGWKGAITVGGGYAFVYTYTGIVVSITKVGGNTSGIKWWDFSPQGLFAVWGNAFGQNLQLAQIMFFVCIVLLLCGFIIARDFLCHRGWFIYGNSKSSNWYCYWDYAKFKNGASQKDWGQIGKYLANF